MSQFCIFELHQKEEDEREMELEGEGGMSQVYWRKVLLGKITRTSY